MRAFRLTIIALTIALLCIPGALAQEQAHSVVDPDFTFGVFGDSRPGNRPYSPVLEAIAWEMGGHEVSFVLGTGDYIEGSTNPTAVRRQWDGFFTGLAPLQAQREIPVALAPGNHDIVGVRRNAEIFREYFNHLYFSFDYRECHFIILDSETVGSEGRITGAQLEWLKEDLSGASDAKFIFVALHRPLFPTGPHVGSSLDAHPSDRDALHALFVEHGVSAVFAGHEHLYNHQERDGIHYFITGGAGAPLYAPPERGGFYHYLVVTVGERTFTVDVRPVDPLQEEPVR